HEREVVLRSDEGKTAPHFVIAPDAGDCELQRGEIDKEVVRRFPQAAKFVVGKLAVIVIGVLSAIEDVHHFIRPHWHQRLSTTALINAKMAELTPMANARVNTATIV